MGLGISGAGPKSEQSMHIPGKIFVAGTALLGVVETSSAEFSTFPVKGENYNALECRPKGDGPFPVVVYNHGSIVDAVGLARARQIGNKLDEICSALAQDGFVAFFPIREKFNAGPRYADYLMLSIFSRQIISMRREATE